MSTRQIKGEINFKLETSNEASHSKFRKLKKQLPINPVTSTLSDILTFSIIIIITIQFPVPLTHWGTPTKRKHAFLPYIPDFPFILKKSTLSTEKKKAGVILQNLSHFYHDDSRTTVQGISFESLLLSNQPL